MKIMRKGVMNAMYLNLKSTWNRRLTGFLNPIFRSPFSFSWVKLVAPCLSPFPFPCLDPCPCPFVSTCTPTPTPNCSSYAAVDAVHAARIPHQPTKLVMKSNSVVSVNRFPPPLTVSSSPPPPKTTTTSIPTRQCSLSTLLSHSTHSLPGPPNPSAV